MKKAKNLLLLLFCGIIAAASFSSCFNSDDNDYTIDAATQKKYMTTISLLSPYASNARFYYESSYNYQKYDSIKGNNIDCYFKSDSTVSIRIPVCKLDSAIKISENETKGNYRELFDALHNSSETVAIKGLYCIPYSNWVSSNGYQYLMAVSAQVKVTYGGKEHNVLFAFDSTQSWGAYNSTNLTNGVSLILAGIYLDYKDEKDHGTQVDAGYWRKIQIILTKN